MSNSSYVHVDPENNVYGSIKPSELESNTPYNVVTINAGDNDIHLFLNSEQTEKLVADLNKSLVDAKLAEAAQREDQENAYRHEMSVVV